jgi:hypothetical protein
LYVSLNHKTEDDKEKHGRIECGYSISNVSFPLVQSFGQVHFFFFAICVSISHKEVVLMNLVLGKNRHRENKRIQSTIQKYKVETLKSEKKS